MATQRMSKNVGDEAPVSLNPRVNVDPEPCTIAAPGRLPVVRGHDTGTPSAVGGQGSVKASNRCFPADGSSHVPRA
jgi:hypothetical protein